MTKPVQHEIQFGRIRERTDSHFSLWSCKVEEQQFYMLREVVDDFVLVEAFEAAQQMDLIFTSLVLLIESQL